MNQQPPEKKGFSFKQTFASLSYPNYRLWFIGQMISLFGTWMQSTAMGYYVYELSGSEALLGYVAFAAGIPTILFMLFGGLAADNIPRRRLLILTQTAMMILAFVLSGLTFLRLVQPWLLVLFAFLNGITNAFDAPARQSFILEMVEKKSLSNAIALNSTMFNTATAIGPAIGGGMYALFGPGWCFAVNGFSFFAVIVALLLMKLQPVAKARTETSPLKEIAEGLRYTFREPRIRVIIAIVAVVSFIGFSAFNLMPAWAVNILHGDSRTNGFLLSARGLGSLLAALTIAALGNFRSRVKLLGFGMLLFPVSLFIFSFITFQPVSFFFMFFVGLGNMLTFNLANTMIQMSVMDHFRGRVMGIYSLTFFGFMPIGSLISGVIAERLGAQPVMIVSSLILVLFAVLIFGVSKQLRSLDKYLAEKDLKEISKGISKGGDS